jgi:hypothetical protein
MRDLISGFKIDFNIDSSYPDKFSETKQHHLDGLSAFLHGIFIFNGRDKTK